jgi:hypothetical protein
MKKTLIFLIAVFLTGALSAQSPNQMRYPLYLGITATPPATGGSLYLRGLTSGAGRITVANIAGNNIKFQIPSVQASGVSVLTNDGAGVTSWTSTIDNGTVYVKQNQDTVAVTAATSTMAATWKSKVIVLTNATYTEITIPASTMTAGDVVTFVKYGAGPVRVNCAANVFRKTPAGTDSCTMNTLNQVYQIRFRTANKADFIGDWRD